LNSDQVFRIGEKLISLDKTVRLVERALELREKGLSQQDAANRLQLDRSFVSRLESLGEIRKGNRIAVIGFPVLNVVELTEICREYGLDLYMILNNNERWELVRDKQALDFFNSMLELVTRLREFDTLIMITSNKWFYLAEALLDIQIIHLELGQTPIERDLPVDREMFENTLKRVLSEE